MVKATLRASWRIYVSDYVVEELKQVLTAKLGFSRRLGHLSGRRIVRRAIRVNPKEIRYKVRKDPKDSPVLQAAIASRCDYLVTNDVILLALNPYRGLRIISMTEYYDLLVWEGLILVKRKR